MGCGLKFFLRSIFLFLFYFDYMYWYIFVLIKRFGGEVVCVLVNYCVCLEGKLNYIVWNCGWVGIIDMFGVRWLMYRNKFNYIVSGIGYED